MRIALFIVLLALALPSAQAAKRALTLDQINAAEPAKGHGRTSEGVNLRAQVLLDRANFSPGAIDGRSGQNFGRALRAFQNQNGLPASGEPDAATFEKLTQDSAPAMITYTISDKDVAGPFSKKIPQKFEKMAKLKRLDYTGPAELLAARFHMDKGLLRALNPGKDFDQAGTEIVVANVGMKPAALDERIGKIEVDKETARRLFTLSVALHVKA